MGSVKNTDNLRLNFSMRGSWSDSDSQLSSLSSSPPNITVRGAGVWPSVSQKPGFNIIFGINSMLSQPSSNSIWKRKKQIRGKNNKGRGEKKKERREMLYFIKGKDLNDLNWGKEYGIKW